MKVTLTLVGRNCGVQKEPIKDPSLLAKKRAKAYARKKREEEQQQLQEHGKKWYHSGNRPLPTVGDINNVKKKSKACNGENQNGA